MPLIPWASLTSKTIAESDWGESIVQECWMLRLFLDCDNEAFYCNVAVGSLTNKCQSKSLLPYDVCNINLNNPLRIRHEMRFLMTLEHLFDYEKHNPSLRLVSVVSSKCVSSRNYVLIKAKKCPHTSSRETDTEEQFRSEVFSFLLGLGVLTSLKFTTCKYHVSEYTEHCLTIIWITIVNLQILRFNIFA